MRQIVLDRMMYTLIGFVVGAVLFILLLPASDMCQILYVSQDEIMALETKRVGATNIVGANTGNKNLFFGRIDEAVELTNKFADERNGRSTKVVYSVAPVFGTNVQSISAAVHQRVINDLQSKELDAK